jgi:hypothetical protein
MKESSGAKSHGDEDKEVERQGNKEARRQRAVIASNSIDQLSPEVPEGRYIVARSGNGGQSIPL